MFLWIYFSFFRIAGYENTFIGLKSKLLAMARRKLKDQPEAIDVLSFGKVPEWITVKHGYSKHTYNE